MRKILAFIFCTLLVSSLILHSIEELTQNEVRAATEATPSATFAPGGVGQARSAEISELPTVRLLPDNPLYFLKTLKEKIQLLVTRSSTGQADLLLSFAQKRLAEALEVSRRGKIHISEKLFEAFGQDVKLAREKIAQARTTGEQTRNLLTKFSKTLAYQKAVLERMQEEASRRSEEVQSRVEALNSLLVQLDGAELPEATESGRIGSRLPKKPSGLGIGDWLRSLFGRKDILSPLGDYK